MKNAAIGIFILLFSVSLCAQPVKKSVVKRGSEIKGITEYTGKDKRVIKGNLENSQMERKFVAELTADRPDSILVTSEYGLDLYRFVYNNDGIVTSYTSSYKEGNGWIPSRKITYTYNSQNQIIQEVNAGWDNGAWIIMSRYTTTYNAQGLVVTNLSEYPDTTGALQKSNLTTKEYNSAGLVQIQLNQNWNGTGWENSYRSKYEYNSDGQETSRISEDWENGAWVYTSSSYKNYTEWGALKETIGDYISFVTWEVSRLRISNSYDSQRQLIQELTEVLNDSIWSPMKKSVYQYELNGRVIKNNMSSWWGTTWVDSLYMVDTLNLDKTLPLSYYESAWDNGSFVPTYRVLYSYNSKNNRTSVIQDVYYSGTWNLDYKEERGYDAAGELLTSFNCGFWSNGVLLPYDYYVYVNIDSNVLSSLYLSCTDVKIWYKKVAVPVELTSFTALAKEGIVLLKWQTATETNNKGFEIECKAGNNNWVTLGFVQGKGTTVNVNNYSFTYKPAATGKCFYRLKQIDFDGTVNYSPEVEASSNIITSYSLNQNYPNPFNPSTSISFALPNESRVSLKIFNSVGQMVKELVSGVKPMGNYDVRFDASMLSSGVYFYSIEASSVNGNGSFRNTKKMILVK